MDALGNLGNGTPYRWDGFTRGAQYKEGKAAMQFMDAYYATLRACALGNGGNGQYPVTHRLDIIHSMVPPNTHGCDVIDQFRSGFSHYIAQTKHNKYPPYQDTLRVCTEVVTHAILAAPQAAAAAAALQVQLLTRYEPIHAEAELRGLIAPTQAELTTATANLGAARITLQQLGDTPVKEQNEGQQEFVARQQQYVAASTAVRAAQAHVDQLNNTPQVPDFPIVNGDDASPSDAIMMLFWIVMDMVFWLGDTDTMAQFYKLATPSGQGRDTIAAFGVRVYATFMQISHRPEEAARIPDRVFIDGLNDSQLRNHMRNYADTHLATVANPAERLDLAIQHAIDLEAQHLDFSCGT